MVHPNQISTEARPLKEAAISLRQNATYAEQRVWEMLRGRRLQGLKFRRQHVLHGYIVDFYCHEKRLCIELDGAPHLEPAQKAKDQQRDELFKMRGYQVLRMMNEDVLIDPTRFREVILSHTIPPL